MSWLSRLLGRPLSATDPELYTLLGSGETWAGEPVSDQRALNLSAYWAGVRIKSTTVASLSFDIMERGKDGVKVRCPIILFRPSLDDSPNADQTAMEFWEGRMLGLNTRGNAFAGKGDQQHGDRRAPTVCRRYRLCGGIRMVTCNTGSSTAGSRKRFRRRRSFISRRLATATSECRLWNMRDRR